MPFPPKTAVLPGLPARASISAATPGDTPEAQSGHREPDAGIPSLTSVSRCRNPSHQASGQHGEEERPSGTGEGWPGTYSSAGAKLAPPTALRITAPRAALPVRYERPFSAPRVSVRDRRGSVSGVTHAVSVTGLLWGPRLSREPEPPELPETLLSSSRCHGEALKDPACVSRRPVLRSAKTQRRKGRRRTEQPSSVAHETPRFAGIETPL